MKTLLNILFLILVIDTPQLFSQCNALHFDGVDDYVEAASPFNGNTDFTVEMWFRSESTLVGNCNNTSLGDFRWLLSWDDNNFGIGDCNGELRFVFRPLCPNGTSLCSSLPGFTINDGNWHHVAYTKNNIETRIYIDGNFFINFAAAAYDMSGFFRLGRSGTGNVGKNWKGAIDEVRIWDKVRTESEIQDSYNCGLVGTDAGLVTYFKADQGVASGNNTSLNTLYDQTINNNQGNLSNFSLSGNSSNWLSGYHAVCSSCSIPNTLNCNGLHFDGVDDYVEAASPFNGNTDFTVEMWFRSESTLVGNCDNTSLGDFRWLLSWDDNNFGIGDCNGELRFVFRPLCPNGTSLCSSLPGFTINDGNWHHVAYTKNNIETRIYIDGNFFINFAAAAYDMSGFFRLGRSGTGNVGKNWKGAIDEVRIWDKVRTESEIQADYQCPLSGNESNLTTYYPGNQGIAGGNNIALLSLLNRSSNFSHGILNNFSLVGSSSNWITAYSNTSSNCWDCLISSIKEVPKPEFELFPNPTDETVYLKRNGSSQKVKIQLVDQMGRIVSSYYWNKNEEEVSILVDHLPSGSYVIIIRDQQFGYFLEAKN